MSDGKFPWERGPSVFDCFGFKLGAGLHEVIAGYSDYGGPVLLHAFISSPGQPLLIWRRLWTTREHAAKEAEALVGDIEAYFENLKAVTRPAEDLSLDDFIQHIKQRFTNGLH